MKIVNQHLEKRNEKIQDLAQIIQNIKTISRHRDNFWNIKTNFRNSRRSRKSTQH